MTRDGVAVEPKVIAFVGLAQDSPDATFFGERYRIMPIPKGAPDCQELFLTMSIANELLSDHEMLDQLPELFGERLIEKLREVLSPESVARQLTTEEQP